MAVSIISKKILIAVLHKALCVGRPKLRWTDCVASYAKNLGERLNGSDAIQRWLEVPVG